jgi:hypothetical protein
MPAAMSLSVRAIPTRGRDFVPFLELPYRLHRDLPNWVPPLRADVRALFDCEKNPFFEHAEVEAWVAERAGEDAPRVVGRIAAIVNRAHNEFHGDRVGFWGFFECEDDAETAKRLFDTADRWLAERGLDTSRGPMNFSTNDDCGLLITGFHRPPFLLMPHNPPYYQKLVESAGYRKEKDLLAVHHAPPRVNELMDRAANRVIKRTGVRTRPFDLKHFEREIGLVREIYNSAWEKNWGFVPMTDHEITHMAKQLKPVVIPELIRFAMIGEETVGFGLSLPNVNLILAKLGGRLTPLGIVRLLWGAPRLKEVRVLTLGIREGHRRLGLDTVLYRDMLAAAERLRLTGAEYSWMLEDNPAILRPLERMGAVHDKTYRVYDRPVEASRPR